MSAETAQDSWTRTDPIAFHAGHRPAATACRDLRSGEVVSYRELDDLVARCAGLLGQRLADVRGARVASLLRNSLDAVVLFFACERVGAIYTPLNWRLAPAELAALGEDAQPSLLVYESEFEPGAAAVPSPDRLVVSPEENAFRAALLAAGRAESDPGPPQAPALILYTSGTTGRPKGVVLSRAALFWGAFNFAAVGDVSAASAMLCDAPMFHTVGLVATVRCVLQQGGAVVLSDRFLPDLALDRLADPALGVTHFFGVPQIAQMLCDAGGYAPEKLRRLKGLFVGGAPLPEPLCLRLLEDGVVIVNGYGMTETSTIAGMPIDPAAVRRRTASAGLAAPAIEVRIVAAGGREAAPGEVGEIWVRGPAIFSGYWNQPEATAAALQDGWFRTGDAARRDDDGYLFIVDRWKDMYISGGENVYPAEVESVIAALQGVKEVGVVGVRSERWGEVGCAFVVAEAAIGPEQVAAHCAERLARFKQPAQIRFLDALPRTASGKLRKDELRRMAAP